MALLVALVPLMLALPSGAASPGQGDSTDSFWSFLPKGTLVTPCESGSQDNKDAREAWQRLSDLIADMTPASDPAPALSSLDGLLKMRCFHMAVEQGPPPRPTHVLALKTWWEDGGYTWLWSYLEPSLEGLSTDLRSVAVLPPDPRTVLFRETASDPHLASVLCSQADATCGLETQGWAERARVALLPGVELHSWYDEKTPEPDSWVACERSAGAASPDEAYTAWRRCVGAHRTPVRALPLGRTRAPLDGWLIVSGRRGHYEFCDEIRAHDLATGAAYVSESCSALAIKEGGEVDDALTNEHRQTSVRAGRVPVDNLREAVWMLVLESAVQDANILASTFPIPRGMKVAFRVGARDDSIIESRSSTWSTAWTTLDWRWLSPTGETRAEGELTWPTSDDRAEAHAASLLDIAERGFIETCPPSALPGWRSTFTAAATPPERPPEFASYQRRLDTLWKRLAELTPAAECVTTSAPVKR